MKYYLFILGCQYNYYDAKRIAHLLDKMGYVLSSEKEANLIIVLACSVKQKSVDRIYGKIHNWNKLPQKPKIIISACILENDKKKLVDKVEAIIDSKDIVKWLHCHIAKLLNISSNNVTIQQCNNFTHLTGKGLSFREKSERNNVYLPKSEYRKTAYIPIMQGCDNFCTYCAVPYTRGSEVSRSEKEIIGEIMEQLQKGYKKILLLGQNVNSWDKKSQPVCHSDPPLAREESQSNNHLDPSLKLRMTSKLPFAQLLSKIDNLPYDFTYNFMSSNPHDFTDDLVETLSKLTKWEKVLHLPMQSGDDEILKKMNRKYNANKYYELIANLKSRISNLPAGKAGLQLTTDIIVGFPSETRTQFNNTVKLCKKIGFSKAYISQYSPRPHTLSARIMNDDLSKEEKKKRWEILNHLINIDKRR